MPEDTAPDTTEVPENAATTVTEPPKATTGTPLEQDGEESDAEAA